MANGEKAAYTVQLNGGKGHMTITDHLGNTIQMIASWVLSVRKIKPGRMLV